VCFGDCHQASEYQISNAPHPQLLMRTCIHGPYYLSVWRDGSLRFSGRASFDDEETRAIK
jgi:hypothetical protein